VGRRTATGTLAGGTNPFPKKPIHLSHLFFPWSSDKDAEHKNKFAEEFSVF
jgi:hypothetical protein